MTAVIVELGHHLSERASLECAFAELPMKYRGHLDLSDHGATDLPERLGQPAHGRALRLVQVELRDVRRVEIAHEGGVRPRSSERIAVLSVPRPSFPLRRAYPGRSRRARNGLAALASGTASRRTSGLPRSVTMIAPSSTALRTQAPVRWCSSRIEM